MNEKSTRTSAETAADHRTVTGWIYVAIQVVLLVTPVILPRRTDLWIPAPARAVGFIFIAAGLAAVALAALFLGRSLTPTPVPTMHGKLTTSGLYHYVRHPIHSGVFAVVVGLTILFGSWISLAVAVITLLFFNNKARWEEQQLAQRYDGYRDYAAATPRFVPRPWKTSVTP